MESPVYHYRLTKGPKGAHRKKQSLSTWEFHELIRAADQTKQEDTVVNHRARSTEQAMADWHCTCSWDELTLSHRDTKDQYTQYSSTHYSNAHCIRIY